MMVDIRKLRREALQDMGLIVKDDEASPWLEHPVAFGKGPVDVLEQIKTSDPEHDVEPAIFRRYRLGARQVVDSALRAGVADNIQPFVAGGKMRLILHGPATDIENARPLPLGCEGLLHH